MCCICLCTWVHKLVYVFQRSTTQEQELFWTDTTFQECRVWGIWFRKVLFSVLPLECAIYSHPCSISFSVFHRSGWMWWVLRKNRHFMLFVSSAAVSSQKIQKKVNQCFIFSLLTAVFTQIISTVTVTWRGWLSGSDRGLQLAYSPSVLPHLSWEVLMWQRYRNMNSAAQVNLPLLLLYKQYLQQCYDVHIE